MQATEAISLTMLDDKQNRLIESWMRLADQQPTDEYTRFIALWIAFNAYCYAHYYKQANRERADLRKLKPLPGLTTAEQPVTGTIQRTNNKVTIVLDTPGAIKIDITERYTEDHIFDAFADQHAKHYLELLLQPGFQQLVGHLQQSLQKKPGEYYVVNMAKVKKQDTAAMAPVLDDESSKVRFNDTSKLQQLKSVLYQIRCNIFHGEKVPGDINDDRIAKAVTPVLNALLLAVGPEHGATS